MSKFFSPLYIGVMSVTSGFLSLLSGNWNVTTGVTSRRKRSQVYVLAVRVYLEMILNRNRIIGRIDDDVVVLELASDLKARVYQ